MFLSILNGENGVPYRYSRYFGKLSLISVMQRLMSILSSGEHDLCIDARMKEYFWWYILHTNSLGSIYRCVAV